jgi:integron integrase
MKPGSPSLRSTRLLDQVRERARYLHYSLSTEKLYVYWVRFFVRWHGMKHPRDMGAPEVEAFLSMLASERQVSSSTHNQALSALLFLYREVLGISLPWLDGIKRPSYTKRIPSVLTTDEVAGILSHVEGEVALVARLLYGTGMRLMEGLRLRVKDVDFDRHAIIVREAKGNKDRVVMLPASLVAQLRRQMLHARALWVADQQAGRSGVEVPHALESKYPQVGKTWEWFWVFPAANHSVDPRSGLERRHHIALELVLTPAPPPPPVAREPEPTYCASTTCRPSPRFSRLPRFAAAAPTSRRSARLGPAARRACRVR